jgi:hypothetical protein
MEVCDMEDAIGKNMKDTDSYILNWLIAPASSLKAATSQKTNFEKRLEVVLRDLQRDGNDGVLRFRPRKKHGK